MTLARNRWPVYLASLSSWLPLAGLMYFLPRATTIGANADVTVVQYAMNQFVMVVEYIKLTAWPSSLPIDYGRPWQTPWLQVVPCAIAVFSLLALVALAIDASRRSGSWRCRLFCCLHRRPVWFPLTRKLARNAGCTCRWLQFQFYV